MTIEVNAAGPADSMIVGTLAHRLVRELAPAAEISLADYQRAAAALLGGDTPYWALLARDGAGGAQAEPVGLLTLNQCASIYAGGAFGEIAELYVAPEQRSKGVAPVLLEAARAFARQRGWSRLEVGAPDLPHWQRTVDFYLREGFVEVGPRLKQLL